MAGTSSWGLVDELPDEEVGTAARVLAALGATVDPLLRSLLDAPDDDEPETPEERAAVAETWAEHRRGEGSTTEELRRELGLILRVDRKPTARRDLGRLDRPSQQRILTAIERYAATGQGNVARSARPIK